MEKSEAPNIRQCIPRKRDREKTRQKILDIACIEFAENGLARADTDSIAARVGVTKRMIFYYFNTKDELFTAVLESAYEKKRAVEEKLRLETLSPEAAIRKLVEFTLDFDNTHSEFVRLVQTENLYRGCHIANSRRINEINRPIIEQIRHVLARGVEMGVIREGIDPIELHMTVSALSFFSAANRHTFEPQFGYDMSSSKAKILRKEQVAEMLWRYVRRD